MPRPPYVAPPRSIVDDERTVIESVRRVRTPLPMFAMDEEDERTDSELPAPMIAITAPVPAPLPPSVEAIPRRSSSRALVVLVLGAALMAVATAAAVAVSLWARRPLGEETSSAGAVPVAPAVASAEPATSAPALEPEPAEAPRIVSAPSATVQPAVPSAKPVTGPRVETAHVTVMCDPACDSVLIGGRNAGASPASATVPAGPVALLLRRRGAPPSRVSVTLAPGAVRVVRVRM